MGRGNRLYQAAVRVGTAIRTKVIPKQGDCLQFNDATASFARRQQRVNLSCAYDGQYDHRNDQQHQQHQSSHQRRTYTASPYDATTLGGGVSVAASSWMHDSEEKAEKSRTAAKRRRDLEAVELDYLAATLPIRLSDLVTNSRTTAKRIASADNETKRLDRGAVLRLTIGFFKTKAFLASLGTSIASYNMFNTNGKCDGMESGMKTSVDTETMFNGNEDQVAVANEGALMQTSLNAFVLLVDPEGVVSTASSDITRHLGLREDEIIGQNIDQFIHPEDHEEFYRQLQLDAPIGSGPCHMTPCPPSTTTYDPKHDDDISKTDDLSDNNIDRHFYIRMKCTRVKPGTKTKYTGYILTQWSGRVMTKKVVADNNKRIKRPSAKAAAAAAAAASSVSTEPGPSNSKRGRRSNKTAAADHALKVTHQTTNTTHKVMHLLATVQAMQNSTNNDMRIDCDMFISKHDLALNFKSCDKRITAHLGYNPQELVGKSAYHFHNPLDTNTIHICHKSLLDKGTSISRYYRFLSKQGTWIWLQTRATLIYKNKKPDYVSCMNYVVGQEKAEELFNMMQHGTPSDYGTIRGAIDITSMDDGLWCSSPSSTAASPMYVDSPGDHLKPSTQLGSPSTLPSGQTLTSVQSSSSSGYSSSCEDDLVSPMSAVGGGGGGGVDNTSVFDDVSLLLQQHDFGPVNLTSQSPSPSSPSSTSPANLASPRLVEDAVRMQTMDDLCTDNISFDDLVSTDDWLDSLDATTSLEPMPQSIPSTTAGSTSTSTTSLQHKHSDNFLLDSYLEPSSDLWSTQSGAGFADIQSMMLDPLARSELDHGIDSIKTSNLPDHTLENWLSTDDPFSSLSTILSPTDSGIVSPSPSSPEPLIASPACSDIVMSSIPSDDVFMTTPTMVHQHHAHHNQQQQHNQLRHKRKPTASEKRALLDSIHDDHRYSSKTKQMKPIGRPCTPSGHMGARATPNSAPNANNSILRQFLLCREPLNPNKGSDVAVVEEEDDEDDEESQRRLSLDNADSQLSCLFDMNMDSLEANLAGKNSCSSSASAGSTLECLLTGQMNQRDVAAHEQRLIDTRRRVSAADLTTPPSPCTMVSECGGPSDISSSASSSSCSSASANNIAFDDPYATAEGLAALSGMDLLTMSANDLTSLWQHTDTNNELSPDISDTLHEVTRQDDLLLQHYFNNIS